MRTRVEPRHPSAKDTNVQPAAVQILAVYISDFELTPRRWAERSRDSDHPVVVEVEPRHCELRPRHARLFLDAQRAPRRIQLHHAIPLRIAYDVAENRCALRVCGDPLEHLGQMIA